VITNSWGNDTDDITLLGTDVVEFYEQFSTEAALTGITVNFSSGDAGDQTAGGTDLAAKTVDFPADLPLVTGVGGSSVFIGSHRQWLGEYGWQSSYSTLTNGAWDPAPPGDYSSGGGGGTSQLFTQPWYQIGKVPASISEYYGSTPMRAVPDIAMDGDPNTGMIVGGAPSPTRVHQPAVLPAARHPGAARHRGADLAGRSGPHRLHQFPGQQPGQVLAAGDRRRAELDPERHPWLRRRDRSGHAPRSGVLPQRFALNALIARGPGRFSSPARAAFTG
jgi:hypothetical protein